MLSSRLVGRAFPRDVAGLRALVANLAGRAQWATIGSSAVTRDVALNLVRRVFQTMMNPNMDTHELSTGIALHSLSLAVTSEVVGTTALVASGSTRVGTISRAETTGETTTRTTNSTTSRARARTGTGTSRRSRAVALKKDGAINVRHSITASHQFNPGNSTYGKVTNLAAVVATAVRTTVETQRGTVSLNVTKSLAVVTLLG